MAASISASSGHFEDLHAATNCCAQREWRAHMHLAAQPGLPCTALQEGHRCLVAVQDWAEKQRGEHPWSSVSQK